MRTIFGVYNVVLMPWKHDHLFGFRLVCRSLTSICLHAPFLYIVTIISVQYTVFHPRPKQEKKQTNVHALRYIRIHWINMRTNTHTLQTYSCTICRFFLYLSLFWLFIFSCLQIFFKLLPFIGLWRRSSNTHPTVKIIILKPTIILE